ncbi:MAG: hypothetical protein PF692_00615 [Kiritimatiellae bacterium]|jgi:hypothetical protein|nr:hypothetical protein [Kiritimatiellia bacterium]
MTRLIKIIAIVAVLASASVLQAQIFDETYSGATTNSGPAYVTSNGVTWVANEGLNISNSAAVFEYTGTANITNTQVAFTIKPVLNDAVPTDVAGAAVVFWVNTSSNVYYLETAGTTVSNDAVNVIQGDGTVDFFVKINYVAQTFDLRVNGTDFDTSDIVFTGAPFYSTDPTNLTQLVIRETSDSDVAVVQVFEVQELDPSGAPTAVTGADIKVYKKDGKVYVELNIETDGKPTYFSVAREDGNGVVLWDSGKVEYKDGQAVYVFDSDTTIDPTKTYTYVVTDLLENGVPSTLGEWTAYDVKVNPMLEAKSFEMTQTQMTLTFASVPDETYKVVGFVTLGGESSLVEDNIQSQGDTTEVGINLIGNTNFYFQIIKK